MSKLEDNYWKLKQNLYEKFEERYMKNPTHRREKKIENFVVEVLHEYTCFKCGDTFQVSHELDTDKPTCNTCFKQLCAVTTFNQYLDFVNNKLQEKK